MLRFNDDASPAGSDSSSLPSTGRGRARSVDFGLLGREGLLDLARTYLEVQARLWPDLAGTTAVPAPDAATIAAMADDFEIESLRLGELADETGVHVIGASDGFDSANPQSSLLLPVLGSMNVAFITQLRSNVRRGMDDDFRRGDNIQPPGVGYRLVDVRDASGSLVITHKGTIEKRAEIDPEAAAWIVRGAEMIAREVKSPIEVARLFNEQRVGGRQTWSDNMIRKLYSRERLVGREVFRTTRQEKNRTTGKIRYVKLPQDQWLVRESPHLRILPNELADAVRAKLKLAAQSFGRTAKDHQKKA